MLNRRILRIKAFKALYGYAENPSSSLKDVARQLEISCEATRDLYLFMMALVSPLTGEAASRIESARNKFNPTEQEKNPNMKFAGNQLASLLDSDPDLQKLLTKKKLTWDQYDVFLRKLYETVRSRDYFVEYMDDPDTSLASDAALFIKIFERELVDDPSLEVILEDLSIYWNDDLAYALTYCCRSFEEIARTGRWNLPPLYQSDMAPMAGKPGMTSDRDFVNKLVAAAVAGYDRYCHMVADNVQQWDKDRLFTTDLCLIALGLAEQEKFAGEIDVRVTINEYVEISKYYSTKKSSSFVNGLLDKLIKENLTK